MVTIANPESIPSSFQPGNVMYTFQNSNETMFVVSLLSKRLFIHHCFPTTNICTIQWHSLIYPLYIVVKTYLLPASPVKVLYFSAHDTLLGFTFLSNLSESHDLPILLHVKASETIPT